MKDGHDIVGATGDRGLWVGTQSGVIHRYVQRLGSWGHSTVI